MLQKVTEVTYKIRNMDGARNVNKIVHFIYLKLCKGKETECDGKASP